MSLFICCSPLFGRSFPSSTLLPNFSLILPLSSSRNYADGSSSLVKPKPTKKLRSSKLPWVVKEKRIHSHFKHLRRILLEEKRHGELIKTYVARQDWIKKGQESQALSFIKSLQTEILRHRPEGVVVDSSHQEFVEKRKSILLEKHQSSLDDHSRMRKEMIDALSQIDFKNHPEENVNRPYAFVNPSKHWIHSKN